MTPGPNSPRGFLTGLFSTVGPQIDRRHDEEQAKQKARRADIWTQIQDTLQNPGKYQDPQSQVNTLWGEYQKLVGPETKKRLSPIGQLFQKLHPQKPQQQGSPQAPGAAGPALRPSSGPAAPAAPPEAPPQQSGAAPSPKAAPQSAPPQASPQASQPSGAAPQLSTPQQQMEQEFTMRKQRTDRFRAEAKEMGLTSERDAANYVMSQMGTRELTNQSAARPTALDLRKQAEAIVADDGATEADKKAAQGFLDSQKPKLGNMTKQWVNRPGSEEPEIAFVNPKDPKGFVDAQGQPLPEGTKSVATPTQQRMYGQVLGYYYYFRGQGLSDKESKDKAGEMFVQREGQHLGRLQQQSAIDEALSGVAMGSGFGATAKPVAKPSDSAPGSPRTTSAPSAARAPASIGRGGSAQKQKEQDDILFYLGGLLGTQKGGGKAGAVRNMEGQKALAKLTGLDPMSINAALSQDKATAKQLAETVQRQGAIQRLNNTLEAHGQVLASTLKDLQDTGSPLLNRPVREWKRKVVGSPELKRFEIAQNAVQREYAYLTAGGAQSRAMLPVTVTQNMEHMFSDDATPAEVLASLGQVRTEASKETEAMQKTVNDLKTSLSSGAVGSAVSGKINVQIPGHPPGQIPASAEAQFLKDNPGAKVIR